MNDIYLELAQSQMGKSIFDALNLPNPPELFRSPEATLLSPHGRALIAGTKNGFALKSVIRILNSDSIKLCSLKPEKGLNALFATQGLGGSGQPIDQVALRDNSNHKFKYYIFDATALSQADDLQALYSFFHRSIKRIKKNGRVFVLGSRAKSGDGVDEATLAGSLEGFVKSLAKEIGKKGASCNLVMLDKGTEKQLQTALFYFLGDKSAYVTGQTIDLVRGRGIQRRIDWNQPLKGKIALVTGAAQGIGAETARVLARDGARVVCLDIPANESKLKKFSDTIGGDAVAMDLSDADAPDRLVSMLAAQLGVLDIVIHNAGITRDKTLANMPDHFWQQVIDINLSKIMLINELLLGRKLLSERARIVCISSISGIAGNFGQTNYATSKAGIAAYVKKIATLLSDGKTINAIAPGFIETEMTRKIPALTRQVGRRSNSFSQGGIPLDVAEAVSLFCHPGSQAMNGNVLRVCGQSILGK